MNTHCITISWAAEDVQSVRPDLDDEQAATVLDFVLDNHDANEGINWGVIECAADALYGAPSNQPSAEVSND